LAEADGGYMGIFEECVTPQNTRQYRGAKVDSILASLSKQDRESLIEALKEESISPERISSVLSARGIIVGKHAIKYWRMSNLKKDS
jgi:hypothetical protein